MRFIYNLGFLIILIGLSSCEKSEFRQDLTGTWEIFGSGGGISGQGASYDSTDQCSWAVQNGK
jgi:hypothetical protein